MDQNLKEKLNNITIPEDLDSKIELGFDEARTDLNKRKNRFRKTFVGIAASFAIMLISMSLIGFDKVEAAIKQALQYIPGFNYVIESDEENVLVLKDWVFYEEDDFYVIITAAAKLDGNLNVAIKSNYMIPEEMNGMTTYQEFVDMISEQKLEEMTLDQGIDYMAPGQEVIKKFFDDVKISLKDESGDLYDYSELEWGIVMDDESWNGEFSFEVEDSCNNYILLVNDMEVPFDLLEKATKVENLLQLGNHASDKGIDVVAIKKPLEDGLMISLLNQSEDKMVTDYLFNEGFNGVRWNKEPLEFEKSMYILDKEGNKTYPNLNLSSSFDGAMSNFYFDIEDKQDLQLILPFLQTRYIDLKSDALEIETPNDGELVEINKVLTLGEFEINVFDVKRQGEEILIRVGSNSLENEFLNHISVGGINGYVMDPIGNTGEVEIVIDVIDVGSSFSIYFEEPETILLGNWIIDLD